MSTLSNDCPLTMPPPIEFLTFLLNPSLLLFRSSAASLFSGSLALGSKNRNWTAESVSASVTEPRTSTHL